MSDILAIALGVLFLAVWVALVSYYESATRAYTQGRIDQIRHKSKHTNYSGVPAWFYRQGRLSQAKQHKLKVHSRTTGTGYGTSHLR